MKLKSISYHEYKNEPQSWELEKFDLSNVNLLVGQNAAGKTRTLNIISGLASILCGDRALFTSGNYYAEFQDKSNQYEYFLEIVDSKVVCEKLIQNNDKVLIRNGNITKLYFADLDQTVQIKIPDNTLCITRRDELQHPFFEGLFGWGENTIRYGFGEDLGKSTFSLEGKGDAGNFNIKDPKRVVSLFASAEEKFGSKFKDKIVEEINLIGYNIEEIGLEKIPGVHAPNFFNQAPHGIYINESGIEAHIYQHQMSDGMFRALSLIIQLNCIEFLELSSCVIIDDVGEGLDFERSTQLIKLLIKKGENSFVQLLMATNDRFVMNVVELKYWCVIVRENHKCRILNYSNSKEIFDEFGYTGLNNFDFFTSEFYKEKLH